MSGRILVGTSSWADPGFVEEWYPQELAARDRLPYYAERFELVEVNATFYAIPDERTVERWAEATPAHFVFDVKLHRALSRHAADLQTLPRDMRERVETAPRGRIRLTPRFEAELAERTVAAVEPLRRAGKLGAFLLQLTPAFKPHAHALEELETLLGHLHGIPLAIELRHRGWVEPKRREHTLGWFEEHGVTWVGVDAPDGDAPTIMPRLDAVTNPSLAYLRAHGRNLRGYLTGRTVAERFAYEYADDELREIGGRAAALAEEAQQVHVQFNNNRGDDAPRAATRMRELLGQRAVA